MKVERLFSPSPPLCFVFGFFSGVSLSLSRRTPPSLHVAAARRIPTPSELFAHGPHWIRARGTGSSHLSRKRVLSGAIVISACKWPWDHALYLTPFFCLCVSQGNVVTDSIRLATNADVAIVNGWVDHLSSSCWPHCCGGGGGGGGFSNLSPLSKVVVFAPESLRGTSLWAACTSPFPLGTPSGYPPQSLGAVSTRSLISGFSSFHLSLSLSLSLSLHKGELVLNPSFLSLSLSHTHTHSLSC